MSLLCTGCTQASCPLLSCFVVRPLKKKKKIPLNSPTAAKQRLDEKIEEVVKLVFEILFFNNLAANWELFDTLTVLQPNELTHVLKPKLREQQRNTKEVLKKNLDNGVNRSTTPTQLDFTLITMETGHCGGFKQARVSAKKIFGARNVITRWKKTNKTKTCN